MERTSDYYKVLNQFLLEKSLIGSFIPISMINTPNYIADYIELVITKYEDLYSYYSVEPCQATVMTSQYKSGISAPKETISDLSDSHGIDVLSMLIGTLSQDTANQISKHFLQKLSLLCDKNPKKLSRFEKIQSFIYKILKKEFIQIKKVRNISELVHQIDIATRNITLRSRRGGAHFAIVSMKTAALLQESKDFEYFSQTQLNTSPFYPIGNIHKVKIFVNPYALFNDRTILVGRVIEKNDPGLQMFFYDNGTLEEHFETDAKPEVPSSYNINLMTRYALQPIGSNPERSYEKIIYKEGKSFYKRKK